jgi:cholesterol oxidase
MKKTLASPATQLAYRYDAVIVGSGYGAAIVAARLAQAGLSVAVLERGREWAPGEFPSDEASVVKAVRTPFEPLGLFDANVQPKNDLDVVVGCGLGGTSLINAGIALRPEDAVFEQPEWPASIQRAWREGKLAAYYDRAEEMLGAYADGSLAAMRKVALHEQLVAARGVSHGLMKLAVSRHAHERHGAKLSPCTHCGDCVAGCNVGAKNTLATNYLPLAKHHKAKIFTGLEVRTVAPAESGWELGFRFVDGEREGTVVGGIVVLGAGSMGSTEILLRSQRAGLPLGKMVGARFSGNADIMALSYAGRTRTDVLGYGATVAGVREGWPVGTTISSYGDFRRGPPKNLQERFLLLQGAIPTALATLVSRAFGAWGMVSADARQRALIQKDLLSLSGPDPDGALNHSMLFLACGHDSGSGRLVLDDDDERVHVAWKGVGDERCFAAMTDEMMALTEAHGGLFAPNPRSTLLGGSRQMTVHPLGGLPMGDDVDRGAVDHRGRVYDPEGKVHLGLYVADGSVIPRSLGVTPLLTISALAERIADGIVKSLPALHPQRPTSRSPARGPEG